MASRDEISSTERLLDLIRGTSQSASTINPVGSSAEPSKIGLLTALTFQKTIGIGVEIGTDDIKVAKINRIADRSLEIMDYASVAIEPMETVDSPRTAKTLAAVLNRFCAGLKRFDIWCCISSAKVETRCIRIPKLPKKQIPNAVFWAFSKEVDFSDKEMLLDFRILGDVQESGMTKTQVMTFTIPIAETERLKRLFTRAGYPLGGISIVPFAIQNLLKTGIVQPTGPNACCLFIGRDWSRITIHTDGNLILSRGIKTGISSMIEAIAQHYRQTAPDEGTAVAAMAEGDTEPDPESDPALAAARKDFYRFLDADRVPGPSPDPQNGLPVDIFRIILPAVERLVKQVERTIAHFAMHFKGSTISQMLISGKMTASSVFMAHIGSLLGLPVDVLNPFPQPHPFTRNVKIPDAPESKERFVPAIGVGISTNELTPNFLFTYRHREKRDRARRLRIGISAASIAVLAMLLFGFLWQENQIAVKTAEVARLTRMRDALHVPLTPDLVMGLYAKMNQKRSRITSLGRRYYCLAVMEAVCRTTPANIRLLRLHADMDAPAVDPKKRSSPMLVIEGIVTGDLIRFETDLAGYLIRMEALPLFSAPTIESKRLQYMDDRQVLRFSIHFELA